MMEHGNFTINVISDAMLKLLAISEQSGVNEIGGLLIGHISPDDPMRIVVTDVTVPKQKVTGASIDFDDASINEQLSELFFNESDDGFIGWWHTHGTGGTFWSSTDQKDGINKFLTPLVTNDDTELSAKWIVSIVMNASGEMLGRVDYLHYTPFGASIQTVNDVSITSLPEVTQAHRQWADELIKQRVQTKTYNVYRYGRRAYGGYYSKYMELDDEHGKWHNPFIDDSDDLTQTKLTPGESKELIKALKEYPELEPDDVSVLHSYGYSIKECIGLLTDEEIGYPDTATFLDGLSPSDAKKAIRLTTDYNKTYPWVIEKYFDGFTFDQMVAMCEEGDEI